MSWLSCVCDVSDLCSDVPFLGPLVLTRGQWQSVLSDEGLRSGPHFFLVHDGSVICAPERPLWLQCRRGGGGKEQVTDAGELAGPGLALPLGPLGAATCPSSCVLKSPLRPAWEGRAQWHLMAAPVT